MVSSLIRLTYLKEISIFCVYIQVKPGDLKLFCQLET